MSVRPLYTMHCDGCFQWVGQTSTTAQVRLLAKNQGWVRRRRDDRIVDLCPTCGLAPCLFGPFDWCERHESSRSAADPTKCLELIEALAADAEGGRHDVAG